MKTILAAVLMVVFGSVWATGTPPPFGGGDATATAVGVGVGVGTGGVSEAFAAGASGGGANVTNKTTAYAIGGTGLTSTPSTPHGPPQGSRSIGFGAYATTFTEHVQTLIWQQQYICSKTVNPWECDRVFFCGISKPGATDNEDASYMPRRYLRCDELEASFKPKDE